MNLRNLKQEISKKAIEGYKVKTNFSLCEIEVNPRKYIDKCVGLL